MGSFHAYLQNYFASLEAYAKAGALSEDGLSIRAEYESVQHMVAAVETDKLPVEWKWLLEFLRIVSQAKRSAMTPMTEDGGVGQISKSPVVIVAGGADPRFGKRFDPYEKLLSTAFDGFHGIIISGGTKAGIPGIMGAIAEAHKRRAQGRDYKLIAYRPENLPDDAPLDERYDEHIKTEGKTFSPLEPIRSWADLVATGVDPRTVCILGINGGDITAAEYHIGLALGATVGVIEDSGRKASELMASIEEWPKSYLIQLLDDPMTVRAFVFSKSPSQPRLSKDQIDKGGQVVHDVYEETARERREKTPWDKTREEFKDSSRQQVSFAPVILAACGFELVPLGADSAVSEFNTEELECMAEKEHGRWCIERLLAGWRVGPKDVEKKISPYLVNWNALPSFIQDYDRDAVKAWPRVFAAMGYAIRRNGKGTC